MRHTFATELLEWGVDAVTVAELLGHRGMQTIRNYALVRGQSRARAMRAIEDALHPPTWRIAPHKTTGSSGRATEAATPEASTSADDVLPVVTDVDPPTDPRSVAPAAGRRGRPKLLLALGEALSQVRSSLR